MKYLMLFADRFEDVEAIATMDVLKRGGGEVVCASMMKRLDVETKCGNRLIVDKCIEDVNYKEFDCLIIPGGPGSFQILDKIELVDEIIKWFAAERKLVCAICAAPFLIGRLGLLNNHEYTCYPGFDKQVIGGTYLRDKGVVSSGLFITAKSMYYSIEFGLAIYQYFYGVAARVELEKACKGEA